MKFSSMINFSSIYDDFIIVTMMQIHELIKRERLNAGLTEDQMAEKLNIPRATYQNWEKTTPSVEKIRAVSKVLNLHKDFFFINSDEITGNNDDNIITRGHNISSAQEPVEPYEQTGAVYKGKDILLALIEEKEKAVQKAEDVTKKTETYYEDAKADKEKLFTALNKLQSTFDDTLIKISENLKETAASLKSNHDFLLAIGRTVRANDAEILEGMDHLEGNPVGTRQKRSHTVQKALREGAGATGKKAGTGKTHKDVNEQS